MYRDVAGPKPLRAGSAFIHQIAERSSSRNPAVPMVATYRILTQVGEYRVRYLGTGAGPRGACSGLSTSCMSMQNLAINDRFWEASARLLVRSWSATSVARPKRARQRAAP